MINYTPEGLSLKRDAFPFEMDGSILKENPREIKQTETKRHFYERFANPKQDFYERLQVYLVYLP